jgi:hypothetical protein
VFVGAAVSTAGLAVRRAARVSLPDLLKLSLFGTTQFGLGLVFLTVGGQMVSATENALINTREAQLAVGSVSARRDPLPTLPKALSSLRRPLGMSGAAVE